MSTIVKRYRDRVSTLPMQESWTNFYMCKYQGFWYDQGFWLYSSANFSIEATMALQDDFKAKSTDVFLASHPKSGTTWLKALAFAIVNRTNIKYGTGSDSIHPLVTTSPHDCVPFIETESFLNNPSYANGLMATHIPYTSLPKSIISSGCRIVYICRNPKDVLISIWHFRNKLKDKSVPPTTLEGAFELFTKGIIQYGSIWDHVIGYRKASLERSDKVLFLNYEKMQQNANNELKKLANFLGCPFTEEEEATGEVEKLIELCSFEKLSMVNTKRKDGNDTIGNEIFFRKGKVGDSVNYLTTEMIQILDKITKEKYDGLDIST